MKKESVPEAEGVRVEQSPKQLLGALRIWSGEVAPGARLDGEGTKKKPLREPKEMNEEGSWTPGQGKGPPATGGIKKSGTKQQQKPELFCVPKMSVTLSRSYFNIL